MYSIRKATILDLDRIFEIETACFPIKEAAKKDILKERILTFKDGFIVAENEKEIIGFVNGAATNRDQIIDPMFETMKGHHNEKGSNLAIYGLDVHPDYQGKGYSKILMNAFIDEAKKSNRKKVILTCKAHLIGFYEKFGYKCEGVSNSVHGGAKWYDMALNL
jgi:ribosomal protein S18 acetylase RimI-like enzyme